MTDNVVAFARPRPAPPALEFVEVRLDTETCNIVMSVIDEAGDVSVLTYRLVAKSPETFDMNLLRAAWSRWRGGSQAAS